MRFVFVAAALACASGCDKGEPPPVVAPPPHPTPPPDAAVAPADASPVRVSLPPPPAIPASLAAAPAWITRRLDGGAMPSPQVLETFTLRREGTSALLTVTVQHATESMRTHEVSPWSAVLSTKQYLGTFAEITNTLTLDVAAGAETLHFVCKRAKETVATATAVRRPHPKAPGCTGDQGHWDPAATTPVDVLHCELPEGFQEAHGWFVPYLAFAPAPGIEWLFVNDDCSMQGGGWRRIAADGAIAGFRSPKDRH